MKFEYVAQTNVCTNISIFALSIASTLTGTWFNYCFVIQALPQTDRFFHRVIRPIILASFCSPGLVR